MTKFVAILAFCLFWASLCPAFRPSISESVAVLALFRFAALWVACFVPALFSEVPRLTTIVACFYRLLRLRGKSVVGRAWIHSYSTLSAVRPYRLSFGIRLQT